MATVISNDNLIRHSVDKYNFKVLAMGGSGDKEVEEEPSTKQETNEKKTGRRESDVDSTALSQNSKDSLIESLMKKKTDEMSSNFIKLQMKLETMSEEHAKEIKKKK